MCVCECARVHVCVCVCECVFMRSSVKVGLKPNSQCCSNASWRHVLTFIVGCCGRLTMCLLVPPARTEPREMLARSAALWVHAHLVATLCTGLCRAAGAEAMQTRARRGGSARLWVARNVTARLRSVCRLVRGGPLRSCGWRASPIPGRYVGHVVHIGIKEQPLGSESAPLFAESICVVPGLGEAERTPQRPWFLL